MLKIIFAGTPDIAKDILESLIAHNQAISHVYTQPDRPAGRGRHLSASPVKTCALANAIPVLQPESLKGPEQAALLRQLAPDLLVVVAYGLLLPPEILSIPRYGCINIHFSLLPRWRGATPVQQAILAGDKTSGVSIIQMNKGLDTGPIIGVAEYVMRNESSEDLFAALTPIAQALLLETLAKIEKQALHPVKQDKNHVTFAPLIQKQDAKINWQRSACEIDRHIRAYYPWPIAFTSFEGEALRIFKAHVIDEKTQEHPGLLLAASDQGLDIATGLGILRIKEIQLPGRRRMPVADMLHSHHLSVGILFV